MISLPMSFRLLGGFNFGMGLSKVDSMADQVRVRTTHAVTAAQLFMNVHVLTTAPVGSPHICSIPAIGPLFVSQDQRSASYCSKYFG
jgi:hypothetical protein